MNLKKLFFGGAADAHISRRKKSLVAAGTVLVLLFGFACGNAYGKYVQGQQKTGTIFGKAFYFESDFLDVESANKTYTVYPGSGGTASVAFRLQNHIDELRVSEMDISYTVTVKEGANDVTDAVVGVDKNGTLALGGLDPKAEEPVQLNNLAAGKTYLVTVTGNGGYVKTIQAKFVVTPLDKNVYKHLKIQGEEVLLTVWTENVSGNAVIRVPAKLVPDNTDPAMYGAVIGPATVTDSSSFASTYSSHLYRFFNPEHVGGLDVSNFNVSVNGTTANPGTP